MKQVKAENATKKQWVVATKQEVEEARAKGLYKGIMALPEKEKFDLCPIHVWNLTKMVSQEIEEMVTIWHESGEEDVTKEEFLHKLERLLYMLEDLYPYYFKKYVVDGKLDFKKWRDDALLVVWTFTTPLKLIRHLVAFPHNVEEFYKVFEKDDLEDYANSKFCGICGNREAYDTYPNITVHEKCAIDKGWYKCLGCNWLYPNDKKKCKRGQKCNEHGLVKAGTIIDPFGDD